jgi:hypothetical protein
MDVQLIVLSPYLWCRAILTTENTQNLVISFFDFLYCDSVVIEVEAASPQIIGEKGE